MLSSPTAIIKIACLLLWSSLLLLGNSANGQTSFSNTTDSTAVVLDLDNPQSKEAVRDLVSRMSDDSVRELLIQRMDAVVERDLQAGAENRGALAVLSSSFGLYWNNAAESLRDIGQISGIINKISSAVNTVIAPDNLWKLSWVVLLAAAVGLCAERVVAFLFRKRKQQLIDEFSTTLWGILRILYTRLSFDLLGVLAFALATNVVLGSFFERGSMANDVAYMPLSAAIGAWFAFVICRFFFAPRRPDLRICNTTDERAMRLTVSFSILAAYIVMMHNAFYLFVRIGMESYGSWDYMGPLGFLMNVSLYLSAAWVIWLNREALTEILINNKQRVCMAIGDEAPADLSWFAIHWPKIAITLIIAKYFLVEVVVNSSDVGVYSTAAVYITFIVIFLWPGIDANVSLCVAKGIQAPEDESIAAGRARRSMQQGLLRVGRVLVVGVVLYALASLWGLNLLGLAEAGLGAQTAGNLVGLLFIALIAYMSLELVSIFIGHWMAKEGGGADEHGDEAGGEIGGVGLSRTATLLPIVRKTARFVIATVSIIMVLDHWGVNIGPILAGAGVVGLAIGFGAQTLVKDIVSGLFFLADDAFRVGEYIDVGGTMGNVEKISLRSLRLRHHRGLVHTIPYGEIPKLTNFSRDWVIMKLRFRVPFDTDVNKVKKLFKKIGNDLLEDPELGEDFLQPFKSQGVAEVDDNGIVVRGKFMAKPGKQFMIRKELYVRVQKAFDEAGIPFARKQVMVHIPGLEKMDDISKGDLKAIGAAAADAAEEPPSEELPKQSN